MHAFVAHLVALFRLPPSWLLFTVGFYGFVLFGAFEADDAWRNSLYKRLYNPGNLRPWWYVLAEQIAEELRSGFRYRPAQIIHNHLTNYFLLASLRTAVGYYFAANIAVTAVFFGVLSSRVGKNAAETTTILAVSLQAYRYDAINPHYCFMGVVQCYLMLVLLHWHYLWKGRSLGAYTSFTLGLLFFEYTVALLPFTIAYAWKRRDILFGAACAATTVAYAGVYLVHFDGGVGDYKPAFDVADAARTYLLQLCGVLPHGLLPEDRTFRFYRTVWLFFGLQGSIAFMLLGTLAGIVIFKIVRIAPVGQWVRFKDAYALALCLCAVLFAPLAFTGKFHMLVGWGSPYIPVYWQYFGVAIVLAPMCGRHRHLLALPIAIVCAANTFGNYASAMLNQEMNRPRRILERELDFGLLDDLPQHMRLAVVVSGSKPRLQRFYRRGNYLTEEFFQAYSGRRYIPINLRQSVHAPFAPPATMQRADALVIIDLLGNAAHLRRR